MMKTTRCAGMMGCLRRAAVLAAATAAGMAWAAWPAAARGEEGRTVYYQVTYDDGRMADLAAVPETNRGITHVMRIARVEQGAKGLEILSTGPQPLTFVSRGQTYRTDMAWNGKAWVALDDAAGAVAGQAAAPAAPPAPAAPAQDTALQAEVLRTKGAVMDLAARLLETHEKLEASARKLDANSSAAAALGEARKEILECVRGLLAGAARLGPQGEPAASQPSPAISAGAPAKAQEGQPMPPGEPAGQVTLPEGEPADANQALGAVRPIRKLATLPHRVQVWPLPPSEGKRSYRVSMEHGEAGPAGGFYYVAYADADGDGQPDKLLARSALAQAERPGQWSQWEFPAADRQVYVGKAWDRPDTVHYHTESVVIDAEWRSLSGQTFISVDAWGIPLRPWGPCYGNIRVWTGQPPKE